MAGNLRSPLRSEVAVGLYSGQTGLIGRAARDDRHARHPEGL